MLKDAVKIIKIKSQAEGFKTCIDFLYQQTSKNSVLFLSGGTTPKVLYEDLAREKKLRIGAVALIDERYGGKLHQESNEKMIRDTGFIKYLEKDARFYPVLQDKTIQEDTKDYDETVRYLFNYFPKSIGILGIGKDGHIAGIPAVEDISQKILEDKSSLAAYYEDKGIYKKRITLTFLALSKLDLIIVLVFGKEKKKALNLMFKSGSIAQIPARFLLEKGIAEKVVLITDQKI